jgi:hypothetical protein
MSLVPDGAVVLLRWPTRQRENGPAQPVGIAGDVDAVNAVVGSEADPQQGLRAPVGCDHDARGTVDEQDGTGPRALGEALDDREVLGRTARLDGRTGVQSAAGPEQPRRLHRVVGAGNRSEQPKRDRPQVSSVCVEALREIHKILWCAQGSPFLHGSRQEDERIHRTLCRKGDQHHDPTDCAPQRALRPFGSPLRKHL